MMPKIIIALALMHMSVLQAADPDRWVWSSYGRQEKSDRRFERIRVPVSDRRGDDRGPNRFPSDDDIDRYEVKEPTTPRPALTKPQNDELDGFIDDPRYGNGGQGFGNGGQGFGDPNGFAYPGSGFVPRPPSGNPANGVLVGPGGPTGIIGRPKGNPANGVLVGPGGPTGVIGRPYPGGGSQYPGGAGQYPGVYPGGGSQYPGGAGQYPGYFPGGGGQFPGGFSPGRPGPGGFPGQYPGGFQGQYPSGNGFSGGPGSGQYPGGFQGQYPNGGGFSGGPGPGQYPGGFQGQYPGGNGFSGGPGGFPGQYPGGGQYPLGYPGDDQGQFGGQYPGDDGFTPYNNNPGIQFDDNNNSLNKKTNKGKPKDDRRSILKSL